MFGYPLLKSILDIKIDSERSEIFLFYIKITFKNTTKYKSLYLKINSTKVEPNTY